MARILVVDDEEQARHTIHEILKSDDHEIIEARNGEEALILQKTSPFDFVVTDILMPAKAEIEAIWKLKRSYPDLKIIGISGGGRTCDLVPLLETWEEGVESILTKPFSQTELAENVSARHEMLSAKPETPPHPIPSRARGAMDNVDFLYSPVWEITRNSLHSYLCEPMLLGVDGRRLTGEKLYFHFDTTSRCLELDIAAVYRTYEKIYNLAGQEIVVHFIIPVHYSTLADGKMAQRYIDECRRALKFWIKGVVFEIIGTPADCDDLPTVLQRISTLGKSTFVRIQPSFGDIDGLASQGARSIGLDLRDDGRPEDKIMRDLEAFAERARASNILAHVYGLKTISLSIAAITAGFNIVGSDVIAFDLEGWGMDNFLIKPIDLFKTYLKGKAN